MKHFSLPEDGGICINDVPSDILHACDKIYTDSFLDQDSAADEIVSRIIRTVKNFFTESPAAKFKLGFSTGSSPVPVYDKLARAYKEGKISFKDIEIYSTDEFYAPDGKTNQRRSTPLVTHLIEKIDVLPENVHLLDGTVEHNEVSSYCADFDAKARNIDLLVMGLGEKGQVGFNEMGAEKYSRTRSVMLSYNSRKRQAANFNGNIDETPKMALSIGMSTMLSAKKVYLMAWGEEKSDVVRKIVEENEDQMCPASFFQDHGNVHMFVDKAAGSQLTREVAPWLLGPCNWTPKFRRKAVIWLSQKVGKPVLLLSQKDYLQNSLGELIEQFGPYDKLNIDIFNDLQHTITGWPGGKPNADDSTRPVPSNPYPKTVLIFSPHPDDDVISMGGTFIRLVYQGHNVHVAYQTSGNVAVHDDVVLQHMDACAELGFENRFDEVKSLVESKIPGQPEPRALLELKAAIRRSEARAADRSFGLDGSHVHFLNLPFYESGGIIKLPRTQKDVDIIKNLMKELAPDQIYMAGDLADPHGTHRVCTEAAMEALFQLKEEGISWAESCTVWLYRGAWMEWDLGTVDMAVPISPAEVIVKRHAIYHHLSQKDIVPFPGEDPREFWQRAEDRTQNTARLYSELGMAKYQAIELFVKYKEK
ncbi:MAG: PIG-L family deacetylase [Bacteroidales bacterium]|nr:PIG-L family deacetylase [Bacteroidales bacterium]